MSTGYGPEVDEQQARTPVLVVTPGEMYEYVQRMLDDTGEVDRGYTQSFSWRKTDFSRFVNGAVTTNRAILGGDVSSIGGWSVAETTGTAGAAIRLHDGQNITGEAIVRINLAANESTRDLFPRKGIECYTGRVFLEVISGSVEGVLYWR